MVTDYGTPCIVLFERYDFYKSFLLHKHKLKRFSGHVSLIEPYQQLKGYLESKINLNCVLDEMIAIDYFQNCMVVTPVNLEITHVEFLF